MRDRYKERVIWRLGEAIHDLTLDAQVAIEHHHHLFHHHQHHHHHHHHRRHHRHHHNINHPFYNLKLYSSGISASMAAAT
jgi:hypothetical protein